MNTLVFSLLDVILMTLWYIFWFILTVIMSYHMFSSDKTIKKE